jgi:hypothetical protein
MNPCAFKIKKSFVAGVIVGILATYLQNLIRWLRNYLKKQAEIEKLRGGKTPQKRSKIDKFLFGSGDKPQKVETWKLIVLGLMTPILMIYSSTLAKFVKNKAEIVIDKTKEKLGFETKKEASGWKKFLTENAFQILVMSCIFLIINKDLIKAQLPEDLKKEMHTLFANITKIFKPAMEEIKQGGIIFAHGFGFDALPPTQVKNKYMGKTHIKPPSNIPRVINKDWQGSELKKQEVNMTEISQNLY